jgi:cell pole-organizing protein PopZ
MTDRAPPDSAPEPSMEEILASIRQIISEDLASAASAAHHAEGDGEHADDDDDVLILRERATPEPSPFAEPDATEPPAPEPELHAPEPEPAEPEPVAGQSLTVAPAVQLAVVEPETAAAVAASFERLTFVVENTPPPPPVPVSHGGATLEDITRDILTPVIKAWLDANLPAIVQARVDEEVERITRSRVR